MSEFAGMEELLQDFLLEAGELLSQVDNKLVELEKRRKTATCSTISFGASIPSRVARGFSTSRTWSPCAIRPKIFSINCATPNYISRPS
jgi:hypothetical protein